MEELLAHKASVKIQDYYGWNALMLATMYGKNEVVNSLINAGASSIVNVQLPKAAENETALMLAKNNFDIVRALVGSGADVNVRNLYGRTALMCIIEKCYNTQSSSKLEIMDYLLNSGAVVDACDKAGNTALMIACIHRDIEAIKCLIVAGADPTITNSRGFSCKDLLDDTPLVYEMVRSFNWFRRKNLLIFWHQWRSLETSSCSEASSHALIETIFSNVNIVRDIAQYL